jgi:hypothetical protein
MNWSKVAKIAKVAKVAKATRQRGYGKLRGEARQWLSVGSLFSEHRFDPVKRLAPIGSPRGDPELLDQHTDECFERNPACCQMPPVEIDGFGIGSVDSSRERARHMDVRMIGTEKGISRLPVIDEQFTLLAIHEPVLVHPGCRSPAAAESRVHRVFFKREDMRDIEQEPPRPSRGYTQ